MPHYVYITPGLHPRTLCTIVVDFTVCVRSFYFLLLSDYPLQSIMAHAPRNSMVGGIGRLGRAAVYKKRALYKRTKVRALVVSCVSGVCIYGIPLVGVYALHREASHVALTLPCTHGRVSGLTRCSVYTHA